MAKLKVFVEDFDQLISKMFVEKGYVLTEEPFEADIVCFSGGSDVSPMLYEFHVIRETSSNPIRDQNCCNLFYQLHEDVVKVGICRGAQFLNVMMGGELFQHVDGHGETHIAHCPQNGQLLEVTSTHHQMMIPSEEGEVVLEANRSTFRLPKEPELFYNNTDIKDVEAVLYEEEKCFCYQPHPEYVDSQHDCNKFFFKYVDYLTKGQ